MIQMIHDDDFDYMSGCWGEKMMSQVRTLGDVVGCGHTWCLNMIHLWKRPR